MYGAAARPMISLYSRFSSTTTTIRDTLARVNDCAGPAADEPAAAEPPHPAKTTTRSPAVTNCVSP